MIVGISSNIKRHYENYCDFVDYYWINYFKKKNIKFLVFPNSKLSTKSILNSNKKHLNLIILQGGNDIFDSSKEIKNRNDNENLIIKFAIANNIPLLGVCRGMQLINLYFGGKIIKKKRHMRTKHNVNFSNKKFFKLNNLNVNSFHNFCITNYSIGKNLEVISKADDQTIELFRHNRHKIYGVMWHPERSKSSLFLDKLIDFCK
tara:strand:+ start:167 stop:778 length:612 start_codon:yes stop_codon:yes gene_type:complete